MPVNSCLTALRRPRLLVRAARAGLANYVREAHLVPLLPNADPRRDPVGTVRGLRLLEEDCEAARRAQTQDYSLRSHICVLVALLAEMRALSARAVPVAA